MLRTPINTPSPANAAAHTSPPPLIRKVETQAPDPAMNANALGFPDSRISSQPASSSRLEPRLGSSFGHLIEETQRQSHPHDKSKFDAMADQIEARRELSESQRKDMLDELADREVFEINEGKVQEEPKHFEFEPISKS